jgi:SAM-dependent methyltransferase
MKQEEIKKNVRQGYARIAKGGSSCCGGNARAESISKQIGYSDQELNAVPEGANLGLGCGNPVALASLKKGDVVLDLGSGAGFDCFLAAKKVGPKGKVIGVDMTPDMLERARANGRKGNYRNVEFRLGEIENLPAPDNSVNVVISNCVINLSPDKPGVFKEAFRVLKPGGRLMVSDIVLLKNLPGFIKSSIEAYIGCLSGAMLQAEYLKTIKAAGFRDVKIVDVVSFPIDCMANDPTAQVVVKNLKTPREKLSEIARSVLSIKVHGIKPAKKS